MTAINNNCTSLYISLNNHSSVYNFIAFENVNTISNADDLVFCHRKVENFQQAFVIRPKMSVTDKNEIIIVENKLTFKIRATHLTKFKCSLHFGEDNAQNVEEVNTHPPLCRMCYAGLYNVLCTV